MQVEEFSRDLELTSGFLRACFFALLPPLPNHISSTFYPSIATMYKQIATFFALIASAMAFVPEPVAKGK